MEIIGRRQKRETNLYFGSLFTFIISSTIKINTLARPTVIICFSPIEVFNKLNNF